MRKSNFIGSNKIPFIVIAILWGHICYAASIVDKGQSFDFSEMLPLLICIGLELPILYGIGKQFGRKLFVSSGLALLAKAITWGLFFIIVKISRNDPQVITFLLGRTFLISGVCIYSLLCFFLLKNMIEKKRLFIVCLCLAFVCIPLSWVISHLILPPVFQL